MLRGPWLNSITVWHFRQRHCCVIYRLDTVLPGVNRDRYPQKSQQAGTPPTFQNSTTVAN